LTGLKYEVWLFDRVVQIGWNLCCFFLLPAKEKGKTHAHGAHGHGCTAPIVKTKALLQIFICTNTDRSRV
jgi:hypothetical protein